MLRYTLLFLLLGAMLATARADRPNVLLLVADDQRADTIAALGNPDVLTPTLDGLVARGCSVDAAYCMGSNIGAVCRPSRNMLLSGRSYFRWAEPASGEPSLNAPALDNTLPATFKSAGYETYHHGKRGNTAQLIHRQFDHSHYLDDFAARWTSPAGKQIVDDAVRFLANRESDRPWLMYLAFATPHDPRFASVQELEYYESRKLQLPVNRASWHPFDNGSVTGRDEWTALWPRSDQILQDQWADYYAVISGLDQQLGRLLEYLRDTGQLDNTLIVYTSDHGLSMGSHGLMGKQNVYEHGYRAPLIVCGPGVTASRAQDPVYLMDVLPTLCELVGLKIPEGLDGQSFAKMLQGRGRGPREAVMLAYADTQRAVRQGSWKLIRYPQIGRSQLFDLAHDPYEQHDLAEAPEQQTRVSQLTQLLKKLQSQLGDSLDVTAYPTSVGSFTPPQSEQAALQSNAPVPTSKPGIDDLHATVAAGWNGQTSDQHFVVRRPKDGYFTAISVGLSRGDTQVVSGLRFDIVTADNLRVTKLVGDPDARWTPLLDQMNAKRQPIGIHGASGHVIDRLGFLQADGRRSPALGGRGGDMAFELQIHGAEQRLSAAFEGFYGTLCPWQGSVAIESLGILFYSPERGAIASPQ